MQIQKRQSLQSPVPPITKHDEVLAPSSASELLRDSKIQYSELELLQGAHLGVPKRRGRAGCPSKSAEISHHLPFLCIRKAEKKQKLTP